MFKRTPNKKQGEDKRDFDTTSLRYGSQKGWIARDYGAHFFRWGFTRRFIRGGEKVLDIGCGADQPMVRILCHHPGTQPKLFVGVDYDDVKPKNNVPWFRLINNFDFTKQWKSLNSFAPFDVICCFEVIEHMQKKHGKNLLKGAFELLRPGGTFLLSTPVFDGKRMAANHIHEYYEAELIKEIDAAGFEIVHKFGTFMNALTIKKVSKEHAQVWRELKQYYSDDVLACFLAPLYPEHSRNICWQLTR